MKIIQVEGYKAFHGTMKITPIHSEHFFIDDCDWLYKPVTDCWYGKGRSFPADICTVVIEFDDIENLS